MPTEFSDPTSELGVYNILLYGDPKSGKTSLSNQFPDSLILALEPGTAGLKCKAVKVPTWDHFVQYVDLAVSSDDFATVVVDTIDIAYSLIYKKICDAKYISSPTEEEDFGKTWGEIKDAFQEQVLKLVHADKGVILISHANEKEIKTNDGDKVERVQPTMAKQAMSVVNKLADIIAYYTFEGDQRVIRIDGTQTCVAGCRCEHNFLIKGKTAGQEDNRVKSISMGTSAAQGYKNLLRAFNNEQTAKFWDKEAQKSTPKKTTIRRKARS